MRADARTQLHFRCFSNIVFEIPRSHDDAACHFNAHESSTLKERTYVFAYSGSILTSVQNPLP